MKVDIFNKAAQVLLAFSLIATVSAFWRMPCLARSGLARIDPLISYDGVSEHVHAIHGSSGFSPVSGTSELLAGDCTSCQVSQDKSAYWVPPLYFQDAATGKLQLVQQVGGMLAYYFLNADPNDPDPAHPTIHAYPEGFQMIAGDTDQRNFTYPIPDVQKSDWNVAPYDQQAFLRQAALGFNCLNYTPGFQPEGSLFRHFLPDKAYLDANCLDGIRLELMFPSCWNGNVTSHDHKSHVAYPSQLQAGTCPESHPMRLPGLFYETIWNTHKFVGSAGRFVLGNGDPTGFGYHGDYIMGWNSSFLQAAVDTCTNLSGKIEDCLLFTIQDPALYGTCSITVPDELLNEDVVGPMSKLPGDLPIMSGPAYVTKPQIAPLSAAAKPTSIHSHDPVHASAAASTTTLPGVVLAASPTAVPTTLATAIVAAMPATTPAPSLAGLSTSYFSTGYYRSKSVGLIEVLWVENLITSETPAATASVELRKRHKHRHGHGHGRH